MKISRISLFAAVLSCLAQTPDTRGDFRFHRDGVLGTSFDLTVATTSSNEAARVERAVIAAGSEFEETPVI